MTQKTSGTKQQDARQRCIIEHKKPALVFIANYVGGACLQVKYCNEGLGLPSRTLLAALWRMFSCCLLQML